MNLLKKFSLLVFVVASTLLSAPAGAAEVELVKAVRGFCGGSSGSGGTVCVPHRFSILVENLAYEKEVGIHFETLVAGQSTWSYAAASYSESLSEDLELWLVEIPSSNIVNQFVAQYDVAETTYWDNNGGSDYDLGGGYDLGSEFDVRYHPRENVCAACTPGYDLAGKLLPLGGSVYVRNLAYEKDVTVVYTRDNWSTAESVKAIWQSGPNAGNIERFSFSIDWLEASEVSFAVSYETNNQTVWDNNFGRDYTIARP